jgi:hypothetical protein
MSIDSQSSPNLKLRSNRTFICSVLFLDIVEYSRKPVVAQIGIKERFNSQLADCLKDIPLNDRIILDTGDGAAIGFLGDPEDALFVAMSLRDSLAAEKAGIGTDLLIRMGINLGPVKILKDINNQLNLIGDGINVAQRIMSFAEPGQLLVSRSYFDVVSCLSQEYAQLFSYKGARADKHVREHDIYAVEQSGLRPGYSSYTTAEKKGDLPDKDGDKEALLSKEKWAQDGSGRWPVHKKILLGAGALITALIVVIVILFWKEKTTTPDQEIKPAITAKTKSVKKQSATAKNEAPESTGEMTAAPVKKAQTQQSVPSTSPKDELTPRQKSSAKADEIEFTLHSWKSTATEIVLQMRMANHSAVDKSVALYDDSFRWTKSKLTDQTGKTIDVSKVAFIKNNSTTTAGMSGTQGFPLAPGDSALVTLSFKKNGKAFKSLILHPFIYQGRSWKEHDLSIKLGR